MQRSDLHQVVLDALLEHVAVIDRTGVIVAVNRAWRTFAKENGGTRDLGLGVDYLALCDRAAHDGAAEVAAGLRNVLAGRQRSFIHEYPCHSPTEQRFFMLYASPLPIEDGRPIGAVVSHIDITRRRLLELREPPSDPFPD
jgi:PAS domain-containing protein